MCHGFTRIAGELRIWAGKDHKDAQLTAAVAESSLALKSHLSAFTPASTALTKLPPVDSLRTQSQHGMVFHPAGPTRAPYLCNVSHLRSIRTCRCTCRIWGCSGRGRQCGSCRSPQRIRRHLWEEEETSQISALPGDALKHPDCQYCAWLLLLCGWKISVRD